MSKQTSILIMRHILSLKPREVFYRADLLRYGSEHVVDQKIYRLIQAKKIIRLLKGVYIRRQPDGWLPSAENIGAIRAKMLGRIICEDPDTLTAKICNPDEEFETLSFNTTGCTMSFEYLGKTIHFKESTGRKILRSETRIGKAINILLNLGPELSMQETRWFLEKYLSSDERQLMRQQLSGLPSWLMVKIKTVLPNYNPLGYNSNTPEFSISDPYQNHGSGPALRNFRCNYGARVIQKMKETDDQIVANLLKPIDELSTTQKKMLLEKLFRKYWDERVTAEGIKYKLPFKSNSGLFTKLLAKVVNDPNEELEQIYMDVQMNLIQLRQAISQGMATEKQLNQQLDKHSEIKSTLVDKLSNFDSQKEQSLIEKVQLEIDEKESVILDLCEQASEVKKENDQLRQLLKEVEDYASKAYTAKQLLRARLKAVESYERAKQLLDTCFSINLDSEISKFEQIVLESESQQKVLIAFVDAVDETDLLAKSSSILKHNTWVLERVEELLKNLETKTSKIKT